MAGLSWWLQSLLRLVRSVVPTLLGVALGVWLCSRPLALPLAPEPVPVPVPVPVPCGRQPTLQERQVRHPLRFDPDVQLRHQAPLIAVSNDADRLLAVPLDGQQVGASASLFIFVAGSPTELAAARVEFQLDDWEPVVAYQFPFDLAGSESRGRAKPLVVSRLLERLGGGRGGGDLNSSCHRLRARVHAAPTEAEPTLVLEARFRVSHRDPRLFLVCTLGVAVDLPYLPHFLRHYTALGVASESFVLILNAPTATDPGLARAREVCRRFGVQPVHTWLGAFDTFLKWEYEESYLQMHGLHHDWVVQADVDELQRYPDSIPRYLDGCAQRGINAVLGTLDDRVSRSGELAELQEQPSLEEQFPLSCQLTANVVGGRNQKVVAHRAFIICQEGGHHTIMGWHMGRGRNHERIKAVRHIKVAHFKWISGLEGKLRQRQEAFREHGLRWWIQSAKMLAFLKEHGGRVCTDCPKSGCEVAPMKTAELAALPHLEIHTQPAALITVVFHASPATWSTGPASRLVQYYADLEAVERVLVLWPGPEPGAPRNGLPHRAMVVLADDANTMFDEGKLQVQTAAVLHVDDSIYVGSSALLALRERWQFEPQMLVSLASRYCTGSECIEPWHCCKKYSLFGAQSASMDTFCDKFRIVLPKGLIHSASYNKLYSSPKFEAVRAHVARNPACAVPALNYIVADATGKPHVHIDDPVVQLTPARDSWPMPAELSACVAWLTNRFHGKVPPVGLVELQGFHERRHKQTKVVPAHRRFSQLYIKLGVCLGTLGQEPL